jgi:hypothetical protein
VVPADLVAATTQADIAPPPPGAPAWCGGLAWLDGTLVTVIDFAPPTTASPRRRVHLVRLAGSPAAALVVEALGQWALATAGAALPAALRPPGWVCGPGWLRSGISGGERLALLDVTAVQVALMLAPDAAPAAPAKTVATPSAPKAAPAASGARS